jgi:iron complex transport system substrate-binding protein
MSVLQGRLFYFMGVKMITRVAILTAVILVYLLPGLAAASGPAPQAVTCLEEAIVQADDWLSKLANKYYGDVLAFPAIVAATNQKHLEDGSFAHIVNPHVIEPGWKLCIANPADAAGLLASQAPQNSAQETVYPLTLVDGLGREVTIAAPPQRIVSLLPSNTEILFTLGLGDRVVGVTQYDTFPAEAQEKTKIGGMTVESISLETILALEPDLVLAHDAHQQQVIDLLTDNGLTVFAVNSTGLADVYRAIEWIGRIADIQPQAAALNLQIQTDIAAISAKIEQIPVDQRPTVFYEVWSEPLLTAGPETFIGQLISLAGGRNIFADVAQDFPEISPEEVIARNPAVILSSQFSAENLAPEALAARPGWSEIEAVKNGRIHFLTDDFISRPGPRLALALQELVKALYPDLLEE